VPGVQGPAPGVVRPVPDLVVPAPSGGDLRIRDPRLPAVPVPVAPRLVIPHIGPALVQPLPPSVAIPPR
jgi:hypothetical protein